MNHIVMGHFSLMDYSVSLSWSCKDNITRTERPETHKLSSLGFSLRCRLTDHNMKDLATDLSGIGC